MNHQCPPVAIVQVATLLYNGEGASSYLARSTMENLDEPVEDAPKKKRGRPPGRAGRKLAPLSTIEKWSTYQSPPMMDYRHEDIDALVGRQLSMVGLAQDRIREEMLGPSDAKCEKGVTADDVERLVDLSNALVRSIDALQRATKITQELKSKLTPEQVLNAAIEKIKSQDIATLTQIISKLIKHRNKNPRHNKHAKTIAAADGIAALEKE
jgi:hypothetical protein